MFPEDASRKKLSRLTLNPLHKQGGNVSPSLLLCYFIAFYPLIVFSKQKPAKKKIGGRFSQLPTRQWNIWIRALPMPSYGHFYYSDGEVHTHS